MKSLSKAQLSSSLTSLLQQLSQQKNQSIFDTKIDGKKVIDHLSDVIKACEDKKEVSTKPVRFQRFRK